METTDFCSYKLSKALKACGFDEPCYFYYTRKDSPDDHVWLTTSEEAPIDYNRSVYAGCSMPTLAQAQKWLREKWLLHIGANPAIPTLKWQFYIDDLNQQINPYDGELMTRWDDDMQEKADERLYDSYEAALSAGIASALELIKKGE